MKTKKAVAAITAMTILTGLLPMSVSAAETSDEKEYTEPLAYMLEKMRTDENIFYWQETDGGGSYLSEDVHERFALTKIQYDIHLDKGAVLSDAEIQALRKAFRMPWDPDYVLPLYTEKTDETDNTEKTDNTNNTDETDETDETYGITLQKNADGSYSLSWVPFLCPLYFYEDVFIDALRQMPSFLSLDKNAVGFNYNKVQHAVYTDVYIYAEVDDGVELTRSDLPADISIKRVQNTTGEHPECWKRIYTIYLDTETYGDYISPDVIYPILQEVAALDKVKNVSTGGGFVPENIVDPTPYLIDNGAYTLLTRGDCDHDGSITMQDAYQALLCNSAASMDKTPTLSDRGQQAADTDGDGAVSASDAYRILKYTSYEALGTEASWTEILES